jgi:hypothetical protein
VAYGNLGSRPIVGNKVVSTQVLIHRLKFSLTYGYWNYVQNIIYDIDNDDTMIYVTV